MNKITLFTLGAALLFSTSAYSWENLSTGEKIGIGLAVVGAVKELAKQEEHEQSVENSAPEKKEAPDTKIVQDAASNEGENEADLDNKIVGNFGYELAGTFDEASCKKNTLKSLSSGDVCEVSTKDNAFFEQAVVTIDPTTRKIFSIVGKNTKKFNVSADFLSQFTGSNYDGFVSPPWNDYCSEQVSVIGNGIKEKYNISLEGNGFLNHMTGEFKYHAQGEERILVVSCAPDDEFANYLENQSPFFIHDVTANIELTIEYRDVSLAKSAISNIAEETSRKRKQQGQEHKDSF